MTAELSSKMIGRVTPGTSRMSTNRAGFLSFLLAVLVFLTSGDCARKERDFTFWIGGAPQEIDYWETLIDEFARTSGFGVRVVRQPTDSDQRRQGLTISLESKQADPDVFLMDVIWISQFARAGWLEPLDSYMASSRFSIEPFFQRVVDLVDRERGELYALPVYVDGGLLYYRTDLLTHYGYPGPPSTWDELVECARSIQSRERNRNPHFSGFVWQGAQYEGLVCDFLEFASSNGGGIMDDDRIRIDRPENMPALQFMRDLIHTYEISPPNTYTEMKEEEVRRSFQRGDALFERNWPYAWKLHQSEGSAVRGKVGIAPLPHFPGGESASTLGGWHIGISRFSDAKEKAWRFLQFVTSYRTQKALALNLGWNPGREDIYADPEVLAALPHLARLHEVFSHAVSRPTVPYYPQVSEVIQRYANRCLAGTIQPKPALERMQEEIERLEMMYGRE